MGPVIASLLPPTRPLRIVVVLAMVVAVLVTPSAARADTKADRDQVQRKRAAVAAEIDTLRATDQQVEAALRTLDQNVASRTAELRDAQRQSADAEAALAAATERVQAKEAEIAALEQAVKDVAVEAFIRRPTSAGLVDALGASNIGEAELKQSLLAARSTSQLDVLDQLERAREDLEGARSAAAEAATAAQQRRDAVTSQLASVTQARDQQQSVVANVQDRLDQRLGEAQSLARLDKKLAAQIEADQQRIAKQLAEQQAAADAAARKAATATATNSAPDRDPAPAPSAPRTVSITGSGSIVSVRGIQVHRSIADNLARMLAAADGAGISLSGGGYRDPAGQINVRRNNCGTSSYAVYQMPASSCRPPTARPGTSMHERGLAIDVTANGSLIRSRSTSGFRWLAANAARYGFYNLPSEPWHWSVNGN